MKRRDFLGGLPAVSLLGACPAWASEEEPSGFFVVGDTHFASDETDPSRMNPVSEACNKRLVDWLNRLPGTDFPAEAGGGSVPVPRGVIHAGDIIDNGDKGGDMRKGVPVEWAAFEREWGLNGREGRLRWPVREVHGNHDSPRGDGLPVEKIRERNKAREGIHRLSANGLHYSWDWDGVHFVALGLIVGEDRSIERPRCYGALDSLAFLVEDLKAGVGDSGRPVVVVHHVDVFRYSKVVPDEDVVHQEWDYSDVSAYAGALAPYRIAAICCGHTHVRNLARWDGSPAPVSEGGFPFLNTDNAGHFASRTQAFLHVTVGAGVTKVREFATTDAWETGQWTPRLWSFAIA